MGHSQPPTPLQTDNVVSDAVYNEKIQKKAMDISSMGSEIDNVKTD